MMKFGARGIKIQWLNVFFSVLTVIVFLFILIISVRVNSRFNAVKKSIEKLIACEQSSKLMKESANYLNEKAWLFVVTRKKNYVKDYLNELEVTRRQQKSLEMIENICSEKDLAFQRLRTAMEQANGQIVMEKYAIRLVYSAYDDVDIPESISEVLLKDTDAELSKEKKLETAVLNLFGEGYLLYKMRIDENCNLTIEAITQQIKDELNLNADELGANIRKLRIQFFILVVTDCLLFILFNWLVIIPLGRFESSIKKDEKLNVIGSEECRKLAISYNRIYEKKAMNEKSLLRKAEYDALTGILNRCAFEEICENSAREKQMIALVLIDLDNFKHINDTYGHAGGDEVLKILAKHLTDTFRSGDYVSRIGGDEFALILPDCPASATEGIKQKIACINESLGKIEDIKPVSISAGVAFSEVGFSAKLMKNADIALYEVKENGRRGCRAFNE